MPLCVWARIHAEMRYAMEMRLLAKGLTFAFVGCSMDTFTNPDAGRDGGMDAAPPTDAASDGGLADGPAADGSSSDGSVPACPHSTTTSCNNNCGGSGTDGGFVVGHCCVAATGVGACMLACGGALLPCLGSADCAGGSTPICCLTGTSLNLNICPRPYADTISSACTSTSGCTGRHLCTSDGECPDAGHCLQAEIQGTSSKFEFGVCSI